MGYEVSDKQWRDIVGVVRRKGSDSTTTTRSSGRAA